MRNYFQTSLSKGHGRERVAANCYHNHAARCHSENFSHRKPCHVCHKKDIQIQTHPRCKNPDVEHMPIKPGVSRLCEDPLHPLILRSAWLTSPRPAKSSTKFKAGWQVILVLLRTKITSSMSAAGRFHRAISRTTILAELSKKTHVARPRQYIYCLYMLQISTSCFARTLDLFFNHECLSRYICQV